MWPAKWAFYSLWRTSGRVGTNRAPDNRQPQFWAKTHTSVRYFQGQLESLCVASACDSGTCDSRNSRYFCCFEPASLV
jgi:hypothetical protein